MSRRKIIDAADLLGPSEPQVSQFDYLGDLAKKAPSLKGSQLGDALRKLVEEKAGPADSSSPAPTSKT